METSLVPMYTSFYNPSFLPPLVAINKPLSRSSSFSNGSRTKTPLYKHMQLSADPNVVDADNNVPILEREFVEMVVRLAIYYKSKSGTTLNSPITDVTEVLALHMQPLSLDWTSLPMIVKCFYHDAVQHVFTEHNMRWQCIWKTVILNIAPSDSSLCDNAPVSATFKKVIDFLLSLKGVYLVETLELTDILKALGRMIVKPKDALSLKELEASLSTIDESSKSSRPSSPQSKPESQPFTSAAKSDEPVFDYSVLFTVVDFDDFKEFFCRILFSDFLWNNSIMVPTILNATTNESNNSKTSQKKNRLNSSHGDDLVETEIEDNFNTVIQEELKLAGRLNYFITQYKFPKD